MKVVLATRICASPALGVVTCCGCYNHGSQESDKRTSNTSFPCWHAGVETTSSVVLLELYVGLGLGVADASCCPMAAEARCQRACLDALKAPSLTMSALLDSVERSGCDLLLHVSRVSLTSMNASRVQYWLQPLQRTSVFVSSNLSELR